MSETKNNNNNNGEGGVNVTFENLKYSVPVKTEENGMLEILHGISGSFLPGRMTALMGPSGSGKSTLLDVLAARKNSGTTDGTILINGVKPTKKLLKQIFGYVEQFDTLIAELDVYSFLMYTAELKLPSKMTMEQRKQRVEEVIDRLDLHKCRNTIIGDSLNRGISGGQAKRVNIGLAMITRPQVIFLDEPTSGLDSRTANEVVDLLQDLAHEGRTIVCTIHSPTGHAFSRFDDLHMLHSGRTIYDGPVSGAQTYFEGLVGHTMDANCSLPEWLVDLTSELSSSSKHGVGEDVEEMAKAPASNKDFAALYESSSVRKVANDRRLSVSSVVKSLETDDGGQPPSQLGKLSTLLKYRTVAHYQSAEFLGPRFGDKIVFSLLQLALYVGLGDNTDSQSILSTAGVLYFVSAICGYGAAAFVPSLTLERALFYRELNDGCYNPTTYYLSKFIEESAIAILTSLTFTVVTFFGCALQGSFGLFFVIYYLTTMIGVTLAYAVAAMVPTMDAANATLPTLVTIWMYFGGLIMVFDQIPRYLYWFSWTSFLRYSWGAFMLNQFQDESNGQVPVFFAPDGSSLTVLEFYSLEGDIMGSMTACIGLMIVTIGIFSIMGVMALTYIRHDKR